MSVGQTHAKALFEITQNLTQIYTDAHEYVERKHQETEMAVPLPCLHRRQILETPAWPKPIMIL